MVHSFSVGKSDEDNEHDDDSSRNRAIPCRTFIGSRTTLGKDHPWVIAPLNLFFGLLTIPEFNYRFKLSVAKYELMALDVARVIYDRDDEEKKTIADKESIRLNEESLKKVRKRREKEEWQQKKLSELNTNTE